MTKQKIEEIENQVSEILASCGIKELPIPIEKIAISRGLKLKPYDMGDNISGALVIESGIGTIGYNTRESKVRQRFTIAHELGHYELHKARHELFLDEKLPVILYRNENSRKGENVMEMEANAFAAAILMPRNFLDRSIQRTTLIDETFLTELSKLFLVSLAAISIRTSNFLMSR